MIQITTIACAGPSAPILADSTWSSEVALVGSLALFVITIIALTRTPRRIVHDRAALPLIDGTPALRAAAGDEAPHADGTTTHA